MGQASKLFNGNTDQTLIGRVTPTVEQREFLQQQWNDLADYLKEVLAKHGYSISTGCVAIVAPRRQMAVDVDRFQ